MQSGIPEPEPEPEPPTSSHRHHSHVKEPPVPSVPGAGVLLPGSEAAVFQPCLTVEKPEEHSGDEGGEFHTARARDGKRPPSSVAELMSPFSHDSRARANFDSMNSTAQLVRQASRQGVNAPACGGNSKIVGSRTPLQSLIGGSSIRHALGGRLEHGGIYCEADITLNEHGKQLPPGQTRKAFYVAHCGVIDILQSYGLLKQLEALGKSLAWDQSTVSVSPPPFYERRFRVYLTERVFQPSTEVGKEVQVDMAKVSGVPDLEMFDDGHSPSSAGSTFDQDEGAREGVGAGLTPALSPDSPATPTRGDSGGAAAAAPAGREGTGVGRSLSGDRNDTQVWESLPVLPVFSPEELARQAQWRGVQRMQREHGARYAGGQAYKLQRYFAPVDGGSAPAVLPQGSSMDAVAAASSSQRSIEDGSASIEAAVRQSVAVALLTQGAGGDTAGKTKIGHWRVKEVGGVRQACYKNQLASEVCFNIALGVHYLLMKSPPQHEPDPFSFSLDIPSLGDEDSGIAATHVPDFTFKIYKPATFRRLRRQFGIDESAFRNSLEGSEAIGNPGARYFDTCARYNFLPCMTEIYLHI